MTDRRRLGCIVAAIAMLGLTGAAASGADDDLCRASLVASAELSDEGSGIGGTGLSADDFSGIGGTGFEGGSGIGGTGLHVYGTITALGSICVNGQRIVYDDEVAVRVDGQLADASALLVGEVVWLDAEQGDGETRARGVDVLHALVGPIESADPGAGRLSVLGRRVDVLPETRVAGDPAQLLRVGQAVSVSGLWRDADHVVATRIAPAPASVTIVGPQLADLLSRAPAGARLSVQGYVTELGESMVRVGALRIDTAAISPALDVAPGERVRATGRLTVERVLRIEPPLPPDVLLPPMREQPEVFDRPRVFDRPEVFDRPPVFEPPDVFDRAPVAPSADRVR